MKSFLLTLAIFILGFTALVFKEQTLAIRGTLTFCALFVTIYFGVDNYLKYGDVAGDPNRPMRSN